MLISSAAIAQLGERQTEDLKVPGSIPGLGTLLPPAKSFSFKVREFDGARASDPCSHDVAVGMGHSQFLKIKILCNN